MAQEDTPLSLSTLPQDVLISVLCRVPSSDHTTLWDTCKNFRNAFDSDAYASERASTGWAEVSARLVPGEEIYDRDHPNGPDLYGDDSGYDPCDDDGDDDDLTEEEIANKEAKKKIWEDKCAEQRRKDLEEFYSDLGHKDDSYGHESITVDIKVDGIVAGEVDLVLVPRPRFGDLFHEATDAHSGEMQEVGWMLCDRRGSPKVRSIKEADADGSAKRGGFLYVQNVRIRQAYCPANTTTIVARAVRAALTVPELDGKWTLSTAISDARVYMTKEEVRRRGEFFLGERRNSLMEGDDTDAATDASERAEEKKRIDNRWHECMMLDARTFLQLGFKQIPEVVGTEKNQPPWFFALPQYLVEPILPYEDAVAIKMHKPPDLPPSPTGVDKELFDAVKTACNKRKRNMDAAAALDRKMGEVEQNVREEDETAVATIAEVDETEAQLSPFEGHREESRQVREQFDSQIAILRAQMDDFRRILALGNLNPDDERSCIEQCQETEATLASTKRTQEEVNRGLEERDAKIEIIQARMEPVRSNMRTLKRKYESTTFDERCAEKKNELNRAKDDILGKIRKNDEDLKAEVTALVNGKGGSVRKSFVLHCSARFLVTEYVDFLLDLVPTHERTTAVNSIDQQGCTPLHCALLGTPTLGDADMYYSAVQHLLRLGADRNIVDAFGRTPLGQYRFVIRSRNDYDQAFDLVAINAQRGDTEEAWNPIHQRMEEALMPIGGPTDADMNAKGDPGNSFSDEESSDDEMDSEVEGDY
ncbi:hypothetical protein ACHAXR_011471 [Thalassiosira sp. AJA248-18]